MRVPATAIVLAYGRQHRDGSALPSTGRRACVHAHLYKSTQTFAGAPVVCYGPSSCVCVCASAALLVVLESMSECPAKGLSVMLLLLLLLVGANFSKVHGQHAAHKHTHTFHSCIWILLLMAGQSAYNLIVFLCASETELDGPIYPPTTTI